MSRFEKRSAEERALNRKAKSDVAARRMEEERLASDKRKHITYRDPNSKNSQKRAAKEAYKARMREEERKRGKSRF